MLFTFGSNILRPFLGGWCHTDHLEGPSNCIYSNLITTGRASEGRIYPDRHSRCRWQGFNLLNQQRSGKNKATPEFGNHFTDLTFFFFFRGGWEGEGDIFLRSTAFPLLFILLYIACAHYTHLITHRLRCIHNTQTLCVCLMTYISG